MASEHMDFWNTFRGKLRRALDLDPLTQEEADKECKKSKDAEPLSANDIDALIEYAESFGERGGLSVEVADAEVVETAAGEWVDPVKAADMDAELMELVNRNRGEQDDETEARLDEYREKELGTSKSDNDEPGVDDGKDAS